MTKSRGAADEAVEHGNRALEVERAWGLDSHLPGVQGRMLGRERQVSRRSGRGHRE